MSFGKSIAGDKTYENYLLRKMREETWAKNARVEKQPNTIVGRKVVRGLYFVKDAVTILGTGETEEKAIVDAWEGLQGPQYKLNDPTKGTTQVRTIEDLVNSLTPGQLNMLEKVLFVPPQSPLHFHLKSVVYHRAQLLRGATL